MAFLHGSFLKMGDVNQHLKGVLIMGTDNLNQTIFKKLANNEELTDEEINFMVDTYGIDRTCTRKDFNWWHFYLFMTKKLRSNYSTHQYN